MFRFAAGLLLVLLSACGPRAQLFLVPEAAGTGAVETVFVASTRTFGDGQFTSARDETLGYSVFDVAVPPDRDPGEVAWPRRVADPEREFTVARALAFRDGAGFRDGLRAAIASRPAGDRDVMVFVHGFNSTFADGLFRTAQIRHDLQVPGVALHYGWPSAGNPVGYAYDRDSALFARDGLEQFLSDVSRSGAEDIVIVAHSLGAGLVMEVLRQLRIGNRSDVIDRIGGVVLMSPDIDIDVFRSQARRILPLPQPFFIFTSRRDRALRLSSLITGQPDRLGTIGTVEDVAEFDITLIDVSGFEGGEGDVLNHATPISSPAMIRILSQAARVNAAFEGDAAARTDLLTGTILTVQNATQIVLTPDF